MQRDRRLAGAGGAADHHEAGGRPRDERELLGVDQARDVGQVLVGTRRRRRGDRRRAAARCLRRRRARAAPRLRRPRAEPTSGRDAMPAVGGRRVALEDALGRVDALQATVADRDGAADQHLAAALAPGDLLVERVALTVAIEEA